MVWLGRLSPMPLGLMQGKQAEAMTVEIEGDQAAVLQLLPMVFENAQQCMANDFGSRALHAELNDTWESRSAQSQDAGEIQILSDDDRFMAACVIEDRFIRIADLSYITPMGGADTEGSEEVSPAGRKVLIKDQDHDARSS